MRSTAIILCSSYPKVMGGIDSDMYNYFKILMLQGFLAARKNMDKCLEIVEIMQTGMDGNLTRITNRIHGVTLLCCPFWQEKGRKEGGEGKESVGRKDGDGCNSKTPSTLTDQIHLGVMFTQFRPSVIP